MIPEISITCGLDYLSIKDAYLEYVSIDPGFKIKK